jgi:hypothetical protein
MSLQIISLVGMALAVVGLLDPSQAAAQPSPDPALAETLFTSAQACLGKGDWKCACEKFRASMELDPSVSTKLNIAKCDDHDGKLTLAWSNIQEALKLNRSKAYADQSRRKKLDEHAQKLLDDIERRVPKIRVVIAHRPPGLALQKDGKPLPLAALGELIRVDPGAHEIVAEAPGYTALRRSITLAEGQTEEIALTLVKSAIIPRTHESLPPPGAAGPPQQGGSIQRTAGLVIGGVGIVGLGAGAVLGIMTLSASSSAEASAACQDRSNNDLIAQCNALLADARELQTGAIVAAVVGGVVIGTGVVLFATAPSAKPVKSGAAWPAFSLIARPAGVSLAARF